MQWMKGPFPQINSSFWSIAIQLGTSHVLLKTLNIFLLISNVTLKISNNTKSLKGVHLCSGIFFACHNGDVVGRVLSTYRKILIIMQIIPAFLFDYRTHFCSLSDLLCIFLGYDTDRLAI